MPARAKLPPGKGKRFPLNMRTTRELREKFEKSAAESGRSLVQEVEYRMERSFLDEEARDRELGGRELHSLFLMMGATAQIIEERRGQSCTTDFDTFVAVKASWLQLMSNFSPRPQRDGKGSQLIGGLSLDFELPPAPTPPAYPMPRNMLRLHSDTPLSDEEIAAYKVYEKELKVNIKWLKAVGEVQKKAKAVQQHTKALKDLGKGITVELFPPKSQG